ALAQIKKQPPDVVLLDIMMPEMDGFQVLERIKADSALRHIPVVMISSLDDLDSVAKCIENGAEDYLVKPFDPVLLRARLDACEERARLREHEVTYQDQIENYNLRLEERVREKVREISQAQLGAIFAMSKLAESRDPETGEHLERMREYCKLIAVQLERQPKFADVVDEEFVENLYAASPLHDIGKVGVPDRILQKPGKLSEEEFETMKTHAMIGSNTLKAVLDRFPGNEFLKMGIEIAGSHHEKWDGSGYPNGLAGQEIPVSARILALGDVYDALTSKRCYKDAFPHEKAKGIILTSRERHFDSDVVDAFLACEAQMIAVRQRLQDQNGTLPGGHSMS
ncbi:response regulator, partial [Candidatus Sumerlaeota bacterium]|nr:response regulator [Candidatus Sumerlaeota bacterium]